MRHFFRERICVIKWDDFIIRALSFLEFGKIWHFRQVFVNFFLKVRIFFKLSVHSVKLVLDWLKPKCFVFDHFVKRNFLLPCAEKIILWIYLLIRLPAAANLLAASTALGRIPFYLFAVVSICCSHHPNSLSKTSNFWLIASISYCIFGKSLQVHRLFYTSLIFSN